MQATKELKKQLNLTKEVYPLNTLLCALKTNSMQSIKIIVYLFIHNHESSYVYNKVQMCLLVCSKLLVRFLSYCFMFLHYEKTNDDETGIEVHVCKRNFITLQLY